MPPKRALGTSISTSAAGPATGSSPAKASTISGRALTLQAQSATQKTLLCGRVTRLASQPPLRGRHRGELGGPAGTSSAQRWQCATSVENSTFTVVALICASRITKTNWPSPLPPDMDTPDTGYTTPWLWWAGRKCRSRSVTVSTRQISWIRRQQSSSATRLPLRTIDLSSIFMRVSWMKRPLLFRGLTVSCLGLAKKASMLRGLWSPRLLPRRWTKTSQCRRHSPLFTRR